VRHLRTIQQDGECVICYGCRLRQLQSEPPPLLNPSECVKYR
jgi:hypothetical protein